MDKNSIASVPDFTARMSKRLLTVARLLGHSEYDFDLPEGTSRIDVTSGTEGTTGTDGTARTDGVARADGTARTEGTLRRLVCTADVGCDHGYVSMYLVESGISQRAIAMDVRPGPLDAARSNVKEAGLTDRIELRLSDGLTALSEAEADSVIIAGMGGKLIESILSACDPASLGIKTGVLQPQSDIDEVRAFLRDRGYVIIDERVVFEDGKYYFPMLVDFTGREKDAAYSEGSLRGVLELKLLQPGIFVQDDATKDSDADRKASDRRLCAKATSLRLSDKYGIHNIMRKDPLLIKYILHGKEVDESIIRELDRDAHTARYEEVISELEDIDILLKILE